MRLKKSHGAQRLSDRSGVKLAPNARYGNRIERRGGGDRYEVARSYSSELLARASHLRMSRTCRERTRGIAFSAPALSRRAALRCEVQLNEYVYACALACPGLGWTLLAIGFHTRREKLAPLRAAVRMGLLSSSEFLEFRFPRPILSRREKKGALFHEGRSVKN